MESGRMTRTLKPMSGPVPQIYKDDVFAQRKLHWSKWCADRQSTKELYKNEVKEIHLTKKQITQLMNC